MTLLVLPFCDLIIEGADEDESDENVKVIMAVGE